MLNVIFYKPAQTKTTSFEEYDETGKLVTTTLTEIFHPIRDFACETMTSANGLLSYEENFEGFKGSMESLSNADSLFEHSSIKFVHGEKENELADFSSVVMCENMFTGCDELESVKINLDSLTEANSLFKDMPNLKEIELKADSLREADEMFKGTSISYFGCDLPLLESAKGMFNSVITNEDFIFDSQMPSLKYASEMFKNVKISSFECDLSSLEDASYMFEGITVQVPENESISNFVFVSSTPKLKNAPGMFKGVQMSDLSGITSNALENASEMFYGNNSITSVLFNTPSLKNSTSMFENCEYLSSYEGDLRNIEIMDKMFKMAGSKVTGAWGINSLKIKSLEKLKSAKETFYRSGLRKWTTKMPSLEDASNMFAYSTFLSSFESDLSSLKNGTNMFGSCPLKYFRAELCSLENGDEMFGKSILDPESVMYIIDSLPFYDEGDHKITIGINCQNSLSELNSFAYTASYQSWSILKTYITNKGWTVTWKDSAGNVINF